MPRKHLSIFKLAALPLAFISAGASANEAFEQRVEQRLQRLERLSASAPESAPEQGVSAGSMADRMIFTGLLEMRALWGEKPNGESYSALDVYALELGMGMDLGNSVALDLGFLYEDLTFYGAEYESDFDVNVATLTFSDLMQGVDLRVGKQYLPFGHYETAMVNDPLTLEIAEINKVGAVLEYAQDGVFLNAFLFDGDFDNSESIENFGFSGSVVQDGIKIGAGFLSSIAETGFVGNAFDDLAGNFDGGETLALFAEVKVDQLTLNGELIKTLTDLESERRTEILGTTVIQTFEADIMALQLEASMPVMISDRDYTAAASLQVTDGVGGYMPEQRIAVAMTTMMQQNVKTGVEFWIDNGASERDGGLDETTLNIMGSVAVTF